jgi:hypothetical protein
MMSMPAEPCGCGCGVVASLTGIEPCGCGCECCAEKPANEAEELAQLETLRHAIEIRMSELRPLVPH